MATKKAEVELVFVPSISRGHLVPTLEFAKRLIQTHHRFSFSVTVLSIPTPFGPVDDAAPAPAPAPDYDISHLQSQSAAIRFIHLPSLPPPSPHLRQFRAQFLNLYIDGFAPLVKDILVDLTSTRPVAGLVLDFLCLSIVDVAKQLGLPSYLFLTCGAGYLSLMLHLPTRHALTCSAFDDGDSDLTIPGYLNPVPVNLLPSTLRNKHGGYAAYLKIAQRFKDVSGILVNTFAELEPHFLGSFAGDGQSPPVYAVGPVLDLEGFGHSGTVRAEHDKIMAWLDAQPESTVVFLCFGSLGAFDVPQVREIAVALERSGHRFLWSLRLPPAGGKLGAPRDCTNLAETLPEGFMERTGGKGLICGWAPQAKVLAHAAIGGFVSHCGWNSVLESVWNGVPIVTWPLYAEQPLNAFEMVRELGLAVEMRSDSSYGGDVVAAEEIERALGRVMEGDSVVRKRVREIGEKSRKAIMEGGSSYHSTQRFINDIIIKNAL